MQVLRALRGAKVLAHLVAEREHLDELPPRIPFRGHDEPALLPPEMAAIPAPAAAPIAAPLIVPCCCGVMLVQPVTPATSAMATIVPSLFMVGLLYFFRPGTAISNQIVSRTGRCILPGLAAYQRSRPCRTLSSVWPLSPRASRGTKFWLSDGGFDA